MLQRMVLQGLRRAQREHIHHISPLLPVSSKLLPPLLPLPLLLLPLPLPLLPLPLLPLLLLLSVSALLAQSLQTPVPAVFPAGR
jgi:hypothetical protein